MRLEAEESQEEVQHEDPDWEDIQEYGVQEHHLPSEQSGMIFLGGWGGGREKNPKISFMFSR